MGKILVLGCDDVGFEVARRFERRSVVVVDKSTKRVEHLKFNVGYDAVVGDFGSPETLRKASIESAKVVIISTLEFSETKRALEAINQIKSELNICPLVLALAMDESEVWEAQRLGASVVVPQNQVLAEAVVKELYECKMIER